MKHLFALYMFFIASYVFSQQYETYNINYGVDQGLPSSECYQIIQDKKGYIWFGTDRGVVKYNGYEFVTYTTKEGLNNNVVFYIAQGPDNKIWFYDIENKLSYYENDSIYKFKFNKTLEKEIPKSCKPISINVDEQGTIYFNLFEFNPTSPPFKSITKDGIVKHYDHYEAELIFEKDKTIISSHFGFTKTKHKIKSSKVYYHNGNKDYINNIEFEIGFYNSIPRCFLLNNNIYFSIYNHLYVLTENGEITKLHEFNKGIIEIKGDENGNLYIGLYDKGLWVFPKSDFKNAQQIISNCSVSAILIDKKKGIWLSTQEKGLLYLPYKSFSQHISTKNIFINNIEGFGDKIVYSDYSGNIFDLNKENKLKLGLPYPSYIKKLKFINEKILLASLISSHFYIYRDINQKPTLSNAAFNDILISDSSIYMVHKDILTEYSSDNYKLIKSSKFKDTSLNCISKGFDNEILIGTNQGMLVYSKNKLSNHFIKFKQYNARISDIKLYKDILISSTRGDGLVIHKKNTKPYSITEKNKLISNEIHNLYIKDDRIYALSKKGFSLIKINNKKLSIKNYTNKNGLISNEVNDLYENNNNLWVATNKGINKLDLLDNYQNIGPIPIYLTSFNYSEKLINKKAILNYNENKIEFSYEAISFINEGDIKYRYKLEGMDQNWIITKSRKLRYPNLPSGNFKFIISFQNSDNSWSTPVTLFEIEIKKPFWEKLWFIVILILSAISIIIIVIREYIKKINKKLNIKRTIIELERSALQAQMNPHFIFNSLTSIQSLITQKKNQSAEDFLIKFSRLVRKSLNQSSKKDISIKEEIEMINHYLEIESLRFDYDFKWLINIDKEISIEDVLIPPMIFQPFLENALEHGINQNTTEGLVKIEIKIINDQLLECKIIDNGIGIEKSKDIRFKKTESKGIKLVNDRLKIIDKHSKVIIEDLNKTSNESGTMVLIHLPYQNY